MKEAYFTLNTINEIADRMLTHLSVYSKRTRQRPFQPENAALLVLDMQNYFLEPESHAFIPSAPAIVPGINGLIEAFTKIDRPIIATRHTNTPDNAGNMATWWKELILPDSHESIITPDLNLESAMIVEKHRYDAFFESKLDTILAENSVTDIVITGVMTHICCETTSRSAFQKDYNVFTIIDGMATYNLDLHLSSLRSMGHCCARPVLASSISKTISQ